MSQTFNIRRFLVSAEADCPNCGGRGHLDKKPESGNFSPDFSDDGQIVYTCVKCGGKGYLKLTVDLADALKSIADERR